MGARPRALSSYPHVAEDVEVEEEEGEEGEEEGPVQAHRGEVGAEGHLGAGKKPPTP